MRKPHPPREGLVRALPRQEFRASEDGVGMPTLTGHFARFNEPTEINSFFEGNFIERIAPGAFKKTFQEQREGMRVLFQHGMDFVVGDKPLGPIKELREEAEGAFYEVPLLDTSYNRDLVPGLEANLYGASFRFRVLREEYADDVEPSDGNPKGLPERTLREVEVPEFGPVTFPAYEGASAGLLEGASQGSRSLTDSYLIGRFAQDPERFADLLARAVDPEQLEQLLEARRSRTRARSTAAQPAADETPVETPDGVAAEQTPADEAPGDEGERAAIEPEPAPTQRGAIPPHSTPTSDAAWDGPAEVAKLETPITGKTAKGMFAWYDENAPDPDGEGWPDAKNAYKFPHHFGIGGDASTKACESIISTLNGGRGGADIPDGDRQGVWDHAARHLKDAGIEPAPLEKRSAELATPQDPAPPEGAGRDGHPHESGRRDPEPIKEAPPAAADARQEKQMTIQELEARAAEIRSRLTAINEEHGEAELSEDAQTEYDELDGERSAVDEKIERIRQRQENVRALAARGGSNVERPEFNAPSPSRTQEPKDIEAVRAQAAAAPSGEARNRVMLDAALRCVEQERTFYHSGVTLERAKAHVEGLLRREAGADGARGEIAERIIATGSEQYRRSFAKAIAGAPITADEQRALATFVGADGGFAVPYQLDPTVIPTSNHSVNPFRAISRIETIIGNEWKGVTANEVKASYQEEGAEAADGTPTMAQPKVNPERCDAFVPFSIEIEGDWPRVLQELAHLISDGKDDVEALKFTSGAGHASHEPEGILTGATETVETATEAAFATADLYAVEEALPPRFRPRACWVANRGIFNKTRQFDVYGGAQLWARLGEGLENSVPTPGNIGRPLLGYGAYENSTMDAAIVAANKIMIIGDFERYFLIVDRLGMSVEIVNHLVGANRRPTGQRGLFAFWRNSSTVLSDNAFRVLKVK